MPAPLTPLYVVDRTTHCHIVSFAVVRNSYRQGNVCSSRLKSWLFDPVWFFRQDPGAAQASKVG